MPVSAYYGSMSNGSCCKGERLKSTQPLLLAPEEARLKLAICTMQEEQPHFSVLTQSLVDRAAGILRNKYEKKA